MARGVLTGALALIIWAGGGQAQAASSVVVAAGDVACDPDSTAFNAGAGTQPTSSPSETPGRCHMRYTADLIEALAPDRVLGLGDLQNDNGTLVKYQQSFDPSWGRFKSIVRPVPGNHDYASSDQDFDPDAPGYRDYFRDVLAPFGAAAQDPRRGWYSFDLGRWHVVALNSECASGAAAQQVYGGTCAAGSVQEQWLRADLAANPRPCTLAFWHHPLMTSNARSVETKPLWDALHDGYADVVLSGHRHTYERFAPQDSSQASQPGRGIRQFVVGTGGEILHRFVGPPAVNSEIRDNSTFGVLALTLHDPEPSHPGGWYEWRFVPDGRSGSSFGDSGSADCVGPPESGPAPARATSAGAGGDRPAASAADRVAPVLSRVRLSRSRFTVGRKRTAVAAAAGTAFSYTLSEAALVAVRIERRDRPASGKRARIRYRLAGRLTRAGQAGRRRLAFSGRVGRRPLPPGGYRATLSARDAAGNTGRRMTVSFTVVR